MVGICGAVRPAERGAEGMVDLVRWSEQSRPSDFVDDALWVTSTTPGRVGFEQPAISPAGDAFVWTCGSLAGVESDGGHEPRGNAGPTHAYCASLLGRFGAEFPERANGTFAAVVYDPGRERLRFVTDRLGTHPIYYAWTDDGGFVFSTHVQSVVRHPQVDAEFDPAFLSEYCALGRVGGVETPLRGVKQLPPATVASLRVGDDELTTRRYWRPVHRPLEKPFEYFVDRFTDLLTTVLAERFDETRRTGLLLSGGSDSRLLLSRAPADTVGYHLSDWMSAEARTAERAALSAGVEFEWLRRGDDYHERLLAEATPILNYGGRFEQAHVGGYLDRLREDVDVLVSGLFADSLFRGLTVPRRSVSVGPLGRLTLPFERRIESAEAYLSTFPDEAPEYVAADESLRETLRSNLTVREDGSVVDHGVEYDSLRELVLFGDLYPLTNDPDSFYWSLEQTMPHWTPFLDNRFVDLALRMPVRYKLRRNVSNAALSRLSPALADIPHAATGVSLDRPFAAQYAGCNLTALKRKYLDGDTPPQPYYGHHPWTYYPELLRQREFPERFLRRRRGLVEATDALDWEAVAECYDGHLAGEENGFELYTLLSVLGMPATREAADVDADADATVGPALPEDSHGAVR